MNISGTYCEPPHDHRPALVVVTQSFYPEGRYSLATTWVRAA